MTTRLSGPDYPWRLRIEHEGLMSLRLDRRGRCVRVNPKAAPDPADILILTGVWPEHLDGAKAAVAEGRRPTVLAPEPVLEWLAKSGELSPDSHPQRLEVDGISIERRSFVPIPYSTPREALYKLQSAVLRPDRAALRLLRRRGYPKADSSVFQLTLRGGARVAYLGLALHDGTPADWLEQVVADWGQSEWLMVGVDYGHGDSVLGHVGRFGARHILFTDLLCELRESLGLPTELLTPFRDHAVTQGLEADVFVSGAGLRYE